MVTGLLHAAFTNPVEQSITVFGLMPCSMAAASVNALNDEPAWRPVALVARLNWLSDQSFPPIMAST